MKIVVTINLPDKDMDKLWVQKKAQELKRMVDYHLRQDFHGGHGDANTTMEVSTKVEE